LWISGRLQSPQPAGLRLSRSSWPIWKATLATPTWSVDTIPTSCCGPPSLASPWGPTHRRRSSPSQNSHLALPLTALSSSMVKDWVGMGRGWDYWHARPQDLVGDGPGPIPIQHRRPVGDRDGTNPIPDDVPGTRFRPTLMVKMLIPSIEAIL
jgi:hypothetical protein